MNLQKIQHAIGRLSRAEREELATWLADLWEGESPAGAVEEARVAYAESSSRDMTVEEYLAFEEASPWRHEYIDGWVYAMSGATVAHNKLTFQLAKALSDRLSGGPCQVFLTDLKLRLQLGEDEIFYYPDVMVACRPEEWGRDFIRNPKVVAEVLSPSTRHIDQREKSLNYRRTAGIEEYIILSQNDCRVLLHRREDRWRRRIVNGADAVLELRSLGVALPLEEIYDGVQAGGTLASAPQKQ